MFANRPEFTKVVYEVTPKIRGYLNELVKSELYGSSLSEVSMALIGREIERLIAAGILTKPKAAKPRPNLVTLPADGRTLPLFGPAKEPAAERSEMDGSEITRAIRDRGMTITGWARVHGYAAVTVLKIIHDKYGNPGPIGKSVLRDLEKEGLLKKINPPEGTRARKSA